MKKTIAVILMMLFALSAKAQDQSAQEQLFMQQSAQAQSAMTNHRWCGCPTPDSTQLAAAHAPLLNQTYNLAIVFVDFNDAHVGLNPNNPKVGQDSIELWANNINSPQRSRLDGIGSFGWRRRLPGEPSENRWKPQVNKYGWNDYWRMYLSNDDSYRDADGTGGKHPDWTSHKLKAFGSVRQYWSEASYGNISILPAPIPGRAGQPETMQGIVNGDTVINGKQVVKWLSMDVRKDSATKWRGGRVDFYVIDSVKAVLERAYSRGEISLNPAVFLNNPNNKLMVIVAGKTDGGAANALNGNLCISGEKIVGSNSWFATFCIMAGTGVACHEVGHLFGFADVYGSATPGLGYSLYSTAGGGYYDQSPPQPDALQKLMKGWLTPVVITSDTSNVSLPPVEVRQPNGALPKVGIVPLFGTAGLTQVHGNGAWQRGEYYILENRQRIGTERGIAKVDSILGTPDTSQAAQATNQFFADGSLRFSGSVGNQNRLLNDTLLTIPQAEPAGFKGGLLITHHLAYQKVGYETPLQSVVLEADGEYDLSVLNANPNRRRACTYTDFFRAGYKSTIDSTTSPNTQISLGLASGVSLYNISDISNLGDNVQFSVSGAPNYDHIVADTYISNVPSDSILSGSVYVESPSTERFKLAAGTSVDMNQYASLLFSYPVSQDTIRWNNITFQIVKCGAYRLPFLHGGVSVRSTKPMAITGCTFKNSEIGLSINNLTSLAPPYIRVQGNIFENNRLDFYITNTVGVAVMNITDYDKNTFSTMKIGGNAYLITSDFTLPETASLEILSTTTLPTELRFGMNNTMTLLGTARMEACGQILTGLQQKRRVKLTRSGVRPWGGLIINETSRFTTLKGVDIEYANTGIQFNGLNQYNPPIITHSRISNSGYGLYVAPFGGEGFRAAAPSVPLNLQVAKSRITQNGTGVYVAGINNVRIDSTNIDSNTVGVECVSASPLIAFSRIANSSQEGMKLNNAAPKVGRSTFEANRQAVVAENQSAPDFAYEANFGSNAGRNRFSAPQTAIPDETYLMTANNSFITLGFTALGGGYPPPPGPIGTFGFNSLNAPFHLYAEKESTIQADNCYFDQDPPVTLTDESSSIFMSALETEPTPIGWGLDTNTVIYTADCPYSGGCGNPPCDPNIIAGGGNSTNGIMSVQASRMNSVVWQSATMQVITADSLIAEINRAKLTGQWNETGRLITEIGEQLSNGTQGASVNSVQMAPLLVDNGIPKLLRRALGALVSLSYLVGNQVQECQTNLQSVRAIPDFASNHFDLAVIEAVVELNVRKDFVRSRQIAAELQAQIQASGLSGNGNTAIERSYRWLKQTILQYQNMRSRIAHLPAQVTDANATQVVANTQARATNEKLPKSFALAQNYPNPFNPSTNIKYALPRESKVALRVYDVLGRAVTTLVNQAQKAGYYEVRFDASRLATGIYFYRIQADGFVQSKKMLLVK